MSSAQGYMSKGVFKRVGKSRICKNSKMFAKLNGLHVLWITFVGVSFQIIRLLDKATGVLCHSFKNHANPRPTMNSILFPLRQTLCSGAAVAERLEVMIKNENLYEMSDHDFEAIFNASLLDKLRENAIGQEVLRADILAQQRARSKPKPPAVVQNPQESVPEADEDEKEPVPDPTKESPGAVPTADDEDPQAVMSVLRVAAKPDEDSEAGIPLPTPVQVEGPPKEPPKESTQEKIVKDAFDWAGIADIFGDGPEDTNQDSDSDVYNEEEVDSDAF